jgi:hypothetical protein
MPLRKGYSRATIAKNIATEERAGRPRKQALAIALNTAQRAAQKAGKPAKGPGPDPNAKKSKKERGGLGRRAEMLRRIRRRQGR